jgi:sulfur carrier protein ThiS
MIKINLNLFVTLSEYLPDNFEAYSIQENTRLDALVDQLGIPMDQVKLIFVNGKSAALDDILQNGDRVGIFPPVGGG